MPAQRQLGVLVDTTRCVNCKTCEIACKDFKHSTVGVRLRRVRTLEAGTFPAVSVLNFSMSCNHCEEPVCVQQCPAKAYSKRESDGIVVHDPERCIGCRYCTWVCPYSAPQDDKSAGHVRKCDLCIRELEQGRPPVCVAACPLRAIEVGPLEELTKRNGTTAAIVGLPSPELTRPSIRYKLRPEAQHE